MQIRGILFVLAFFLAIVMPASAADIASKPSGSTTAMKPLGTTAPPLKLPDQGTKLPGSTKPIGVGAPSSLNFADKATPLGPPVVGGKPVGGAKSVPGVGGSSTPTSGKTLVNPLKDNGGGATASIDQFTKEAKLKPLTSAGQDVLDQAGGKTAPGRQSGDSLLNATSPDFAAGRGKDASKQEQQSIGGRSTMDAAKGGTGGTFPDVTKTPSGDGPVPIPYPNAGAAKDTQAKADAVKPVSAPASLPNSQGDEAGTAKGTTSAGNLGPGYREVTVQVKGTDTPRVTASPVGEKVAPSAAKIVVLSGRPAPDGPGAGENDIGSALPGANKPTVQQAAAAKKRQAGMPVEGKQEIERMKGNQRAAADTMARKRANAINPGSEGSTVGAVHSTGGAKPTGNSPEGGPSGTSGGRPGGCPADSPSC